MQYHHCQFSFPMMCEQTNKQICHICVYKAIRLGRHKNMKEYVT